MGKRMFYTGGQTFNAQALATNLTNGTYMGLQGASGTMIIEVDEISISGLDVSSIAAAFLFGRMGVVGATLTALAAPNTDGFLNPSAGAATTGAGAFVAATTLPQASNAITEARLNLGMNSFGGEWRWNASPRQEWFSVGQTATAGGSVLMNSTAAGGSNAKANAHILYEVI